MVPGLCSPLRATYGLRTRRKLFRGVNGVNAGSRILQSCFVAIAFPACPLVSLWTQAFRPKEVEQLEEVRVMWNFKRILKGTLWVPTPPSLRWEDAHEDKAAELLGLNHEAMQQTLTDDAADKVQEPWALVGVTLYP